MVGSLAQANAIVQKAFFTESGATMVSDDTLRQTLGNCLGHAGIQSHNIVINHTSNSDGMTRHVVTVIAPHVTAMDVASAVDAMMNQAFYETGINKVARADSHTMPGTSMPGWHTQHGDSGMPSFQLTHQEQQAFAERHAQQAMQRVNPEPQPSVQQAELLATLMQQLKEAHQAVPVR